MRYKLIWFIYAIYIIVIGIAGFGSHDMATSRHLANAALKSPVVEPDDRVIDLSGDGMPNHKIVRYVPNTGGIIIYMVAGALVANLLQGNKE